MFNLLKGENNISRVHVIFIMICRLYEVLRLHPPVPGNVKVALEDDIWPDGTRIRKGDAVCWSPYAQGRSTEIWGPDAKQLRPERWINEQGELRRESQGKFPVFHVGPRVCLGKCSR